MTALPHAGEWMQIPGLTLVRQTGPSDCGAAALATILPHYGRPAIQTAALAPSPEQGIPAGRLRDAVRAQGLKAFLIEGKLEDLTNEIGHGRPVLVGVLRVVGRRGYPHYEVVAGINATRGQVLLADPAQGWRIETVESFTARWAPTRQLTLVIPGERSAGHLVRTQLVMPQPSR